jgi:uncharacterized membrane protein HdeD (DUF308 family)
MRLETTIERTGISLNSREAGQTDRRRIMGIGIFTAALGTLAMVVPVAATFALDILVGLLLVVGGVIHVAHGFSWRQPGESAGKIGAGAMCGFAGVLLAAFPHRGALTLTVLLAAVFTVVGTVGIAAALAAQPLEGWGSLLLGGTIVAGLGAFIWTQLPEAATWTIGLLAGIELLLSGRVAILWALAI